MIERDVRDRHAEMVRLEREVRALRVPVDVMVLSEEHVEEWGSVPNTLVPDSSGFGAGGERID